jgi:hypothetical protein
VSISIERLDFASLFYGIHFSFSLDLKFISCVLCWATYFGLTNFLLVFSVSVLAPNLVSPLQIFSCWVSPPAASSGQESHSWSAPLTRGHKVRPESVLIARDPSAGLHILFLLAISFHPDLVLVLPIEASDL